MHDVPVPDRLKRFPFYKGFLVHYTVYIGEDGTPDFRTVHVLRQQEAFNKFLCHLCGQKLTIPIAFIGGAGSIESHAFVDGPMHEECARYSTKVCPFLLMTEKGHSSAPRKNPEFSSTIEQVTPGRPDLMGIGFTDSYRVFTGENGHRLVRAGDWISVDWDAIPKREKKQ